MSTVLTVFFCSRISHRRLGILFRNDTPLEARNGIIKRSLEDESHRYPHVCKNLQLCEMTRELSSRRMTTLNPSAESTYDLRISRKRNQPHVKRSSQSFVCLFVSLYYKVVNGWKEMSSKVRKVSNNQD